jgi:hypothetical protein
MHVIPKVTIVFRMQSSLFISGVVLFPVEIRSLLICGVFWGGFGKRRLKRNVFKERSYRYKDKRWYGKNDNTNKGRN